MHGLPLTLFYLLVSSQAAGWLLEGQHGGGHRCVWEVAGQVRGPGGPHSPEQHEGTQSGLAGSSLLFLSCFATCSRWPRGTARGAGGSEIGQCGSGD